MFVSPLLEPRVPIGAVVRLARLVVLTTDDQNVAIGKALKADVVIRIECVPVQRMRNRSFGDRSADHVGNVWRLLRVNRNTIVFWSVSCNQYIVCNKQMSVAGL